MNEAPEVPAPPPIPGGPALSEPPTPPPYEPPALRRLVHILVFFFSFFLFLRTMAFEPFGVPTGSMAPTLLGNHRESNCPRCGALLRVGEPPRPMTTTDLRALKHCHCPNCGEEVDLSDAPEVYGDRLLVDKTAFLARSPRRWEVAVFRCPTDGYIPYVKRVVGLPGENVRIAHGDIYIGDQLARKRLAQIRDLRIPVYDHSSIPDPDGWSRRWLMEKLDKPEKGTPRPATSEILTNNSIRLDALQEGIGLTYRNWNFDTATEEPIGDAETYNALSTETRNFARSRAATGTPVHDFLFECDLTVLAGSGSFACRLADGWDTVHADLQASVKSGTPEIELVHDRGKARSQASGHHLEVGTTVHLEFAFIDRRVSLALDGEEVIPPLDLPEYAAVDPPHLPPSPVRGGVSRPLQIGVRGLSVLLKNVKIYRDIHYTHSRRANSAGWKLGEKEYFLLGDNTNNSHDSRSWTVDNKDDGKPAPGVPERLFIGKPFLIHQPMRYARVTFAGRERGFQTLDWSRFRRVR